MKKVIFFLLMGFILISGSKEKFKSFNKKEIEKIAREIKEGKIDAGKETGMEPGERWHNIHSEILKIECSYCHKEKYPENYLYQRKYKVPEREAPGVVMRELCIECHSEKGPAITKLYK